MKFWKKTVLVVLFAVVLEFGYFNFSSWRIRLDPNIEKDITLSLQDGYPVNWEEKDGVLYGLEDPQVIFELPAMQIQTVELHLNDADGVEACLFYYTDADGVVQAVSGEEKQKSLYHFIVKDNSAGAVRFDTESTKQMKLKGFEMVINPTEWDISISRIVAVILIYLVGALLFQTQKMPDYEVYTRKKEEKK